MLVASRPSARASLAQRVRRTLLPLSPPAGLFWSNSQEDGRVYEILDQGVVPASGGAGANVCMPLHKLCGAQAD